jgi:hypothetical protein
VTQPPYLLPWVPVLFLIRSITYTTWRWDEPIAAAGTAQEQTPWRAVQQAAWTALKRPERA